MTYDLRDWISKLEEHNLLSRIADEVDVRNVSALLTKNFRKATIFEKIKGYDIPIIGNAISNRKMCAVALGATEENLIQVYERKLQNPIKPQLVRDGPCKEVLITGDDVDLTHFPIPLQHELDGGPYITAAMQVAKDPRNFVPNIGIYRMMYRTKKETGCNLTSQHHLREYYQLSLDLGKELEVACVLGLHGVDMISAVSSTPSGMDDFEVMGALRGEPVRLVKCETIDVEVPADAEIVLECVLSSTGWVHDEGPYGEFTGVYSPLRKDPVLRVKAISHRKNPIFQTATHGGPHMGWTDINCSLPKYEYALWSALKRANIDIKGIRLIPSSCGRWAIASIRQRIRGDARNALYVMLSSPSSIGLPKYAVVVDDDIDIYDEESIYWAMTFRSQPDQDVVVLNDMPAIPNDPSLPVETPPVTTSKMGIDATTPFGRSRSRFEIAYPPFM